MVYAEYYRAGRHPICGDRSVYILDGRNTRHTQHYDAREWGAKQGHTFYRLMRGPTFTRSTPDSAVFPIN